MHWRLVQVPDDRALESDLDAQELTGLSVLCNGAVGEPTDQSNVYYRAWVKLWPEMRVAIDEVNS